MGDEIGGIKANLNETKDNVSLIQQYKTKIDLLKTTPLQVGYVMNNTLGTIASTTNTRYYAAHINVSAIFPLGVSDKKITIVADANYANWFKYCFMSSNNTLLSGTSVTQVTVAETDEVEITLPEGCTYLNIGVYKTGTVQGQAMLDTTKVYSIVVFGEEYLDTTLTEDKYPPSAKAVGDKIAEIVGNNLTLEVPQSYELVVGDTFQLFYRGIVKAAHDTDYDIVISCDKGNAYTEFYQFTPTHVENITMIISLYNTVHKLVDSAEVILKVVEKSSSPASMKTVLYVGDSLTTGGYVPNEFKRRLISSDGTPVGDGLTNIQFIGTKSNGYVNYEGQGGRTFKSYNEESLSNKVMWITCANHNKTIDEQHSIYKDSNNKEWKLETIETDRIMIILESASGTLPTTGTLTWVSGGVNHSNIVYTASEQASGNPFWDSTLEAVNFSSYATRMGVSSIDYVYVLLGWNGAGGSDTSIINMVKTFINNVLDSFPQCKVILLGLEVPSRDGIGVNYGAKGLYAHYYDLLSYVFNLNSIYESIANDENYIGNVYYVNISGQFDTKHNMITGTRKVNTRNSTTETYQINGVHPAVNGYYQIADACWRDFHHRLQDS